MPTSHVQSKPASYTLGLLLSLYLAQGPPIGFITQALPAILRQYDVSLTIIGLSGFLLIPWALKFMWAPVVDAWFSRRFGRSRSWIVPLQIISALILAAIALIEPAALSERDRVFGLYALLFLVSFFAATQDVATDGLATRTLTHRQRGAGNATQVAGYRLGLILGGGVFLIVMEALSWQLSFLVLAGLVLLNTVPIVMYRESKSQDQLKSDQTYFKNPKAWFLKQFGYFWQNVEMRAWLLVLLTFKMTDGLSSGMVKPMMKDMGISLGEIGAYASIIGSLASLIGAVLAALLMRYLSRFKALLLFLLLQIVATCSYIVVAWFFESAQMLPIWTVFAANAIEHAAAAMALVPMLSVVMDYARQDKAGSDFTFQVCVLASLSGGAHIFSGYVADQLGYTSLFVLSVIVGLVLILPLLRWQHVRVTPAQ